MRKANKKRNRKNIMKIERTKNAGRNILFGGLLKLYQIVVPFLMRTAMIYCMGVQYLGLDSLFISILQVLNLAELGVGSAMVYGMYKPIAEDDTVTICALMKLYTAVYGFSMYFLGMNEEEKQLVMGPIRKILRK